MNSENTRNLEAKRFFSAFSDRINREIKQFLEMAESNFIPSSQKVTKEEEFKKIRNEVTKVVNSLKEESDTPEKIYVATNKILSFKEQLICQFLRVMLYKKNLLWRDLNIPYDDFIHGEVKGVLNSIKLNEEKFGYVPHSIEFKMPKVEGDNESTLPDLISIVLDDFKEMAEAIKNYSKLNDDPQLIEDISKNQHIVKGLREKIEVLTKSYNSLLEKYRGLQISKGKVQLGAN